MSPFGVIHISRGHVDRERNTERIDQQVPLASFDVLMAIKAADASRFFDVWAREEDDVAAFPIPGRKDCLGNWFSSLQFITHEVLCPFPKHALRFRRSRRVPLSRDRARGFLTRLYRTAAGAERWRGLFRGVPACRLVFLPSLSDSAPQEKWPPADCLKQWRRGGISFSARRHTHLLKGI